ncbi:hypothetical protein OIU85_012094 [Salix viminalis]|uniref:Uncharacterized protein n=1 Tax=Salix viminalis TaxID=40686 RepID=A0A9Q0SFZ9_SALVM|nr:hypothetical protein OIU85_012094 [Salix viminalis]
MWQPQKLMTTFSSSVATPATFGGKLTVKPSRDGKQQGWDDLITWATKEWSNGKKLRTPYNSSCSLLDNLLLMV